MIVVRSLGDEIVWPLTAVIVSPPVRPALAAGVPDTTSAIGKPVAELKLVPSLTPRKALAPIWTVDDFCPFTIWVAIWVAALIGIAYPSVDADWNASPLEAAVSMPITLPEESTSDPPESPGWM